MIIKVYEYLKNKEIDVYFQGQKEGICNKEYVVLKDNGQSSMSGSNYIGYKTIDIIIYFPLNRFTQLKEFKNKVKHCLKEVTGLRPTGNETPVIIDSDRKAYTTSIIYQVYKRL